MHVDRGDESTKFWLEPVRLAYNLGFSAKELRKIETIAAEHQEQFVEAWHGYLGAEGG